MAWWVTAVDEGSRVMWTATSNPLRVVRRRRFRAFLAFWRPRPKLVFYEMVGPYDQTMERWTELGWMTPVGQEAIITDFNPSWMDLTTHLAQRIARARRVFPRPGEDFGSAGVRSRTVPRRPAGGAASSWPK